MPAQAISENQAAGLLTQLTEAYKAFGAMDRKPFLSADDRAAIKETLASSTQHARSALEILAQQPGMSPALRQLKGKLIVWTEMAAAELKQASR